MSEVAAFIGTALAVTFWLGVIAGQIWEMEKQLRKLRNRETR